MCAGIHSLAKTRFVYMSAEQRPLSARGAKKKKSTAVKTVKEQRAKTQRREAGGERMERLYGPLPGNKTSFGATVLWG